MRINDDENARMLLDTIPAVMRSIREEMRSVAKGKFTVPQFRILNRLRKGAMTNRELADWMGVTAPTMSRMLEPLEAKDLLERDFNMEDRRSQNIFLTATGRREAEKIRRQAHECFSDQVSALSAEETHALADGLEVLAKMFKDKSSDSSRERTKTSMSTRSRTLMMVMTLTAAAASLSSCMGDKSQDDYVRERVNQERAKIEAIQGTYRGTLVSKDNGQSLGTFALDVRADLDVQNSYDNLTSQPKAVAKGTLYYSGLNQSQINFDKGYYDENSKILQIQIPVTDVAGTTRTLSLHATLDDDTLNGEIEEETLGGFTGSFSITKNGPVSQAQNLNAGRATEISAGSENFVGTSPEAGPKASYAMTIQYQEKSSQQLFLNVFLPERMVTVSLDLDGVPVTFNNAVLDERHNTLVADAQRGFGSSSSYYIKLQCKRTNAGTPSVKWDCRTISAGNPPVHHFVMGLVDNQQLQGQ